MGEYRSSQPLTHLATPSPGPADYSVGRPPPGFQYSILGKHPAAKDDEKEHTTIYDVRDVKLVFTDDPHWSMGARLKDISSKYVGPSPNAYADQTIGTFNKMAFTMSGI
jgi:hypothetical protein